MRWLPLGAALAGVVAAFLLRRTALARPALWASRIAYVVLVAQAPYYFAAKGGFQVSAPVCQWTFGLDLAMHSLTNYPHIVLFALFFLLTYAQMPSHPRAAVLAAAGTLAMGLLVELAQGVTGEGHCRMRDLIPDAAGASIGFILLKGAAAARRFR